MSSTRNYILLRNFDEKKLTVERGSVPITVNENAAKSDFKLKKGLLDYKIKYKYESGVVDVLRIAAKLKTTWGLSEYNAAALKGQRVALPDLPGKKRRVTIDFDSNEPDNTKSCEMLKTLSKTIYDKIIDDIIVSNNLSEIKDREFFYTKYFNSFYKIKKDKATYDVVGEAFQPVLQYKAAYIDAKNHTNTENVSKFTCIIKDKEKEYYSVNELITEKKNCLRNSVCEIVFEIGSTWESPTKQLTVGMLKQARQELEDFGVRAEVTQMTFVKNLTQFADNSELEIAEFDEESNQSNLTVPVIHLRSDEDTVFTDTTTVNVQGDDYEV